MSPTYIYDFLKKLKAEEYIEEIATEKSECSKGYNLTPSGSSFIDKIFSRFDNLIEVAIQSKLEICTLCGVKLYGKFHSEMIHGEEKNFCCKNCAKAYRASLHENE